MASIDEIWLVDFGEPFPGEPAHHRPALVVGPPSSFGTKFPWVIVCPLTTTRRDLPLHVEIEATPGTGLDDICYVQCEMLRSISDRRLVHRLGVVNADASRIVRDITTMLLDH